MNDQFQMSDLPTWLGTPNATSSPVSEAGALLCDSQDGLTTGPCGPAVAPANLSASQARDMGWLTSGTYGRIGSILYGQSDLRQCLVNRLRQRLTTGGSTLFKMTWKEKVTPSSQSVSLLRASGLRTSDRDCGSLPTTTTRDHKDGSQCDNVPLNALLGRVVWLVSWPSPKASNTTGSGTRGDGGENLQTTVQMAGWGTPNTLDSLPIRSDEKLNRAKSVAGCSNIRDQLPIGSWVSPTAQDHSRGGKPPRPQDTGVPLSQQVSGMPATGSSAGMESGGQLNPAHSRWLMGYPTEWDDCAPMGTPSSRKSRQK